MNFFSGIMYNMRGLRLSIKTPKLLALGLIRFAAVLLITVVTATLILVYHEEILNLIWSKPASQWVVWLWYVLSWLLSLALVGVSAILSYLLSQILFCVAIMDYMSRITERMIIGEKEITPTVSMLGQFSYLIKQEIPRAILPVLISLLIMALGLLTPFAPILAVLSSAIAVIFLAWDNTDLVPARQLYPFKQRLKLLLNSLPFHLGFGLPFLIPVLNIFFLSFAPVGATIYHIEKHKQ